MQAYVSTHHFIIYPSFLKILIPECYTLLKMRRNFHSCLLFFFYTFKSTLHIINF